MEALKMTGVSRGYDGRDVLDKVDFSLEAGAFEALMGPSGCGKSTFLHIAAGLLSADSGRVLVGGKEITAMSDSALARFRRRHLGVVFQQFNLLGGRTVRDNVLLPLKLDGAAIDDKVERRLSALASELGIGELMPKKAAALSGGEQQRVAIARSLIAEPDVVLADEPTGNLDLQSAKNICRRLQKLNRNEKSAILLVTHDPVVAAAAGRVNFLKNGTVVDSFDPASDASLVSRRYLEVFG
jgi:ABC-type lipoprotein export system ATPase subunit